MYPTTHKRLLCLWLPNWPIQRLIANELSNVPLNAASPDSATTARQNHSLESSSGPEEEVTEASLPLILLWGADPRRGRLVVARCPRADALGVRPGMTLSQADSLVRGDDLSTAEASDSLGTDIESTRCIRPHDGQADLEALRDLAERCAERLSPLVALEPLDDYLWAGQPLHQPQSLIMDVTGVGALYGGEEHLLAAAAELVTSYGYQARIAIADTAGAAWAVSHYTPPQLPTDDNPHPFRTTAQRIVFDQIPAWIVPPGAQVGALDPLPTAALRLRSETTTMLRRLGIDRIAALRRIPRGGLATRLGKEPLLRMDQALGAINEPLPIHHAAADYTAKIDLEYATQDREILGHQLELLVQQIAARLTATQRGALRMTCRLECQRAAIVEMRLGLFTPTAAADHLYRLLHGHLERQSFPSAVHRVTVLATMTGPLGVRQPTFAELGDLFELGETTSNSLTDLSRLIDALSGRLGRHRVLGVELTQDVLPEDATRFTPLTGQPEGTIVPGRPQAKSKASTRRRASRNGARSPRSEPTPWDSQHPASPDSHSAIATPGDPLRRPLNLLNQPQPIHPIRLAVPSPPETINDNEATTATEQTATSEVTPPWEFRLAGKRYQVARYWGPERIETGWWHGPLKRRDYYRVETDEGQWLWIYHDLRKGMWYLQGYFG